MSDFTLYNEETAPAASRELLKDGRKKYGFLPNLYGYMAESPTLLRGYFDLSDLFAQSSLSPTE